MASELHLICREEAIKVTEFKIVNIPTARLGKTQVVAYENIGKVLLSRTTGHKHLVLVWKVSLVFSSEISSIKLDFEST